MRHLDLLKEEAEKNLITAMASYPEIIFSSAEQFAPHKLAHFLQTFAHHFHQLYNAHKFIVDDEHLRNARFCLISAAQIVLQNGLKLLGVSAPSSM
ncbi:MAG: arginyl-tRNA synthetase [uncultured bacterium]|nr:MAG: arginyl-tRNA synthetase [uncultured bacterium]